MSQTYRRAGATASLLVLLSSSAWVSTAQADSICDADGLQESGSIYRICMPAEGAYNDRLVIWAHGFQDATDEVSIPEDQLSFGDFSIPDTINDLGFAFATNSYSKTGLAIQQGMDDILDLVNIFAAEKGMPEKVYLTGASEGGIITTLLIEQRPDVFAAGLAVCGPVGSFRDQINYFGDARATFEALWPGLIPGDPFHPTDELIEDWGNYYEDVVKPQIFAEPGKLQAWAAVARLPFDVDDLEATLEQSARDVLRYSVVNLNDAVETLGGFPYSNSNRIYSGSGADLYVNQHTPRVDADLAALNEMSSNYDTSGLVDLPLIQMHTTRDQQVPFRHQAQYRLKTLISGDLFSRVRQFVYDRYGHCSFEVDEILFTFLLMLDAAGDLGRAEGLGEFVSGDAAARFEARALLHELNYTLSGTPRIVAPRSHTAEARALR